jgi:hypothetical protein
MEVTQSRRRVEVALDEVPARVAAAGVQHLQDRSPGKAALDGIDPTGGFADIEDLG